MLGMQPVIVTIPGRFPGLNEYTDANRSNPRHGARIKRDQTERVAEATAGAGKIEGPYRLRVTWHERDRRRDVDNIEYALKFILDGLVAAGIVEGDSQAFVRKIEHQIEVDPADPRVVVEVIPES